MGQIIVFFPWDICLCYIRFWSYISSPINMFPLLEPECFDSFNSVTFYFTKSDLEKVKYLKKKLTWFHGNKYYPTLFQIKSFLSLMSGYILKTEFNTFWEISNKMLRELSIKTLKNKRELSVYYNRYFPTL